MKMSVKHYSMTSSSFQRICCYVIVLGLSSVMAGFSEQDRSKPPWAEPPVPLLPELTPQFDTFSGSVVTKPGQTVQLPCRVRDLGDKVVSWIRMKDLHILSSGEFTFTADSRFHILHPEGDTSAWTLQLVGAKETDQGLYECQVNTEPKMKLAIMLTVTDRVVEDPYEVSMADSSVGGPVAHILGPREQYVKKGSTITLTCIIRGLPNIDLPDPVHHHARPNRLVDWIFEGHLLTYQASRGGINLDTERIDSQTWSRLTLTDITLSDEGRYACKPIGTSPAVVTLLVLEGEHTEAMQRDSATLNSACYILICYVILIYTYTVHSFIVP